VFSEKEHVLFVGLFPDVLTLEAVDHLASPLDQSRRMLHDVKFKHELKYHKSVTEVEYIILYCITVKFL
jgi:hypothetical protein